MRKKSIDQILNDYQDQIAEMHQRIAENDARVLRHAKALRIVPSKQVWLYIDSRDQVISWSEQKEDFKPMGRAGEWRRFGEL